MSTAIRYKDIFNTTINGVLVTDASGKLTHINRQAEKILGFSARRHIGCYISDLLPLTGPQVMACIESGVPNLGHLIKGKVVIESGVTYFEPDAVQVEDRAGFIVNALLFPYLNNAIRMWEQGTASMDDIDTAMSLYKRLDASAVMINDHTAFRDDVMPFAGLRESGHGVGGIPYTMEDMQVDKLAVIRSREL